MLLQGLKVVEMATWVAGPSAAAVLADWGADVVKVESPIGDATRVYYPDTPQAPNPIFTNENRGKKGVKLDISRPEGRQALKALLRQADIFVTNVRPGSMKRMGLDYESLKAEMPTMIYAAVTGYGLIGPEADTPAFDMTAFWTRSGVAHATIPGFFRTKDERWLLLLPRTLECFTQLMIALDRPEILAEPRYDPPVTDMDTVREIRTIVDEAFAQWTLAEIGERLTAGDLAWAAMGTLAELADAQYAEDAGCFERVDDGWGQVHRLPASPVRFPEGAPPVSRPAPKLGEHTREVLEAAGLTPEEIEAVL